MKYFNDDDVQKVIKYTEFLPDNTSWKIRLKYILNGWDSFRMCPICHKIINDDWASEYKDLRITCSRKCSGKLVHSVSKNKIIKTNNEKYGTDYPFQSKVIQNKIKNTVHEKYY